MRTRRDDGGSTCTAATRLAPRPAATPDPAVGDARDAAVGHYKVDSLTWTGADRDCADIVAMQIDALDFTLERAAGGPLEDATAYFLEERKLDVRSIAAVPLPGGGTLVTLALENACVEDVCPVLAIALAIEIRGGVIGGSMTWKATERATGKLKCDANARLRGTFTR